MSKGFSNWDMKSCWTVRSSYNNHPHREISSTVLIFEHEVTIKSGGPLGIEIIAKFIHGLTDPRARRNHFFRGGLTSLTLKRCLNDNKRRISTSKPSKLIFRLNPPIISPQTRASVGGNASPIRAPSALSVTAFDGVVPLVPATDAAKETVGSTAAPALPSQAAVLPDQSCIVKNDNNNVNGYPRKNPDSPKQLESIKIGTTTTPYFTELPPDANTMETSTWLRASRFNAFESTFANFSASDILRLSRDDLIQICGLADGIRLFNALHSKPPTPKLTLYFSVEGNGSLWRVAYLDNLTSNALTNKLINTLSLPKDRLHSVLILGPQGIHVLITDELVANMKDDSMYFVETIKDTTSERYKLLLKSSSSSSR